MDKAAYEALSLVLSPDPNVRLAAEARLKELEKLPGWFRIMILIYVRTRYFLRVSY
jgi:hypothetical protein